jgi:NAD(P)-dependent dehydrogenase (short-subunit alcohol dehydrogenase family)
MPNDLAGSVILLTGATDGIGKAADRWALSERRCAEAA